MNYSEIKMFGCTSKQLETQFKRAYNINMYLAGIASDAQEMMDMGKIEQATQLLNQIKYYFFEFTDTRSNVTIKEAA